MHTCTVDCDDSPYPVASSHTSTVWLHSVIEWIIYLHNSICTNIISVPEAVTIEHGTNERLSCDVSLQTILKILHLIVTGDLVDYASYSLYV